MVSSQEYRSWLIDIKQRVLSSQLKAAAAVNTTLREFYWQLGADIVQKQEKTAWDSGFLKQLNSDLMAEFSGIKEVSQRNLGHLCRWYLFYSQNDAITKQSVSQLDTKVDEKLHKAGDAPTIGILLCKEKDKVVAKLQLQIQGGDYGE